MLLPALRIDCCVNPRAHWGNPLGILLMVDVSASGDFGSAPRSKRELAAEAASVIAFSAIRNSDKVGLILCTDRIEQYIPARKGRRHGVRLPVGLLW